MSVPARKSTCCKSSRRQALSDMLSNGLHDVPPGKVAMVVTYLEMRRKPQMREASLPQGVSFHEVTADVAWFRDIFDRVGSREWLWYGRRKLGDADLAEVLRDPKVEHYTLRRDGRDEALVELDFTKESTCELLYFGLTPLLIGTGAGRFLMNKVIEHVWAQPINCFRLDTCTFDSPQAMDFYRRSGFTPIRQAVRIEDDPRIAGLLPRSAGPNVPIFDS